MQKIRIDIPESLESELISEESVKTRDEYFGKAGKPIIPDIKYLLEEDTDMGTDKPQGEDLDDGKPDSDDSDEEI